MAAVDDDPGDPVKHIIGVAAELAGVVIEELGGEEQDVGGGAIGHRISLLEEVASGVLEGLHYSELRMAL